MMVKWSVFVVLAILFGLVNGLSFVLEAGVKRCIKEEVHKDVLVVGEYEFSDVGRTPGQVTDILVSYFGLVEEAVLCSVVLGEVDLYPTY